MVTTTSDLPLAGDSAHAVAACAEALSDMMEQLGQKEHPNGEEWQKATVSALEVAHRAVVFYAESLLSGSAPALVVGTATDENKRPLYLKLVAVDELEEGQLVMRSDRATEVVLSDRAKSSLMKLKDRYPDSDENELIDRAVIMAEPSVVLVQ